MATRPGRQRVAVIAEAFRSRIWPLPVLGLLAAVILGVFVPELDARIDKMIGSGYTRYLFTGGPDAARSVLAAISGSLVTLTSLTFSLTVVTLQLASSQFSPRLLRTFSSDRFVHVTLMLFVSTLVYALMVLRTVRTTTSDSPGFVPQVGVTFGLLLALASVLALVLFLAHLAAEIRVETILRRVHNETRATILRVTEGRHDSVPHTTLPVPPAHAVPLLAPSSGFLTSVDLPALVALVAHAQAILLLERPPGSSLVEGTPIGWLWRAEGGGLQLGALDHLIGRLGKVVTTSHEATSAQDLTFGLKQITDIASKALSPGINDPRTAVHALGHSAALLCLLVHRSLGAQQCSDDSDVVRVHRALPDLASLLDLTVSAPRRYGREDPDVLARIFVLLAEVAWSTRLQEHLTAISSQLERLEQTVAGGEWDRAEQQRLTELGEQVRAAMRGEHRSPAIAISS
jgi:uncharacterized membrane protein